LNKGRSKLKKLEDFKIMDGTPLLLTDRPWAEMEHHGITAVSLNRYFCNVFPEHPILGLRRNGITNQELQGIEHGDFNYVVLMGDVIVMCKQNKDKHDPFAGHIDLALKQSVLAAGQLSVYKGVIKEIDNASGHYLPQGVSAKMAAIRAFKLIGHNNVEAKYVEKFWNGKGWQKKK
jgi:hypothetical protein